jgi:hypothetical protein
MLEVRALGERLDGPTYKEGESLQRWMTSPLDGPTIQGARKINALS